MTKFLASKRLVEMITAISNENPTSKRVWNSDQTTSKEIQELDAITAELAVSLGLGNIRLERVVCLTKTGTTGKTSSQPPEVPQYWSKVFAAAYNQKTYKWALEVDYGIDPNNPTHQVTVSVRSPIHNIPQAEETLRRILESRYPNRN
jgi:hypothetical protein